MKRLAFLAILLLASCGVHFDPCTRPAPPCPEDRPQHLCECKPFEGGGSFSLPTVAAPPVVTPEPEKPAPEPEKPPVTPEHPKPPHHDHKGKWHGDRPTWKKGGGEHG